MSLLLDYYKFLAKQGPVTLSKGVPYSRCVEYPTVVRRLDLGPEDRLLDVGTRYSPLAQILALRNGCSVWAVDPEPGFARRQLEMASRVPRAQRLVDEKKLNFLECDASDLPMDDGFFTKIAAISVLEHIPDESGVVRELARVLHPGGRLVISVPYDPWRDEPKYYRRGVYIKEQSSEEDFYMRYYNDENLRDRLIDVGNLRLVDIEYFGERGFNAHNLIFGNQKIPWYVRRIVFQPLAPLLAALFIKKLEPSQFRHKTKMYTADTAVLVLERAADARPGASE